ncbi:MAG: threonine synthase [Candidatus Falkowbacteria bacterium]
MLFYNTNDKSERVTFQEALLRGQAPKSGLYTIDPGQIPKFSIGQIKAMEGWPYWLTAAKVLWPYLAGEISEYDFMSLIKDAYDETIIPVSIQYVIGRTYILWLTQGPTSSFKDFAARFFARTLNHYAGKLGIKLIVVVATSGDTGPAIASSLHGLNNVAVVALYPAKNISAGQRKQMTTIQDNVYAVEVANGDFNLCQDLAIRLMGDKEFAREVFGNENIFTSANSISLGRLLPQIVFPFFAYSRVARNGEKMIVSIPSGNFGDLVGSVIAMKMGLPIGKIIVAVNENDEFDRFMKSSRYKIAPTRSTYSSAMDVNNPNNLPRLFDLYGGQMVNFPEQKGMINIMPDIKTMKRDLSTVSTSNRATLETIKSIYRNYNIILDPHGAVGWLGLEEYLCFYHNQLAVVWETADPCKFPEVVEMAIGIKPPLAENMARQVDLPERKFIINSQPDRTEEGAIKHSAAQYDELKHIVAEVRL